MWELDNKIVDKNKEILDDSDWYYALKIVLKDYMPWGDLWCWVRVKDPIFLRPNAVGPKFKFRKKTGAREKMLTWCRQNPRGPVYGLSNQLGS